MKTKLIYITLAFIFSNFAYGTEHTNLIVVKYLKQPNSSELYNIKNKSDFSLQFNEQLINVSAWSGSTLSFLQNTLSGTTIIKVDKQKTYKELHDIAAIIEQDFNVEYAYPNYNVYPAQSPIIVNDQSYRSGSQ